MTTDLLRFVDINAGRTARKLGTAWIGSEDVSSSILTHLCQVILRHGTSKCTETYLRVAVKNYCKDFLRRHLAKHRGPRRERTFAEVPDIAPSREPTQEQIDLRIDLYNSHRDLPEDWRRVMALIGDHGIKGIDRLTELDRKAVRKKIQAIKVILMDADLDPRG